MCLISANTAHLAADKVRLRLSADDPHLSNIHTHTHTHHSITPPSTSVPVYKLSPHSGAHLTAVTNLPWITCSSCRQKQSHVVFVCSYVCRLGGGSVCRYWPLEEEKKSWCCLLCRPKLTRAEVMVCFRSVTSRDTLLMMSECISGADLSQEWGWRNFGPLINGKKNSDTINTCKARAWLKRLRDCGASFLTV